MPDKKILTIDEAIDEIRARHDQATQKPLLVGVFGAVNSGKSYFCAKAANILSDLSKPFGGFYGSNDYFLDEYFEGVYPNLEYFFYSIIPCWTTPMPHEKDIDSWNKGINPYTGREIDIKAAIFNPNMHQVDLEYLSKVFDIVISNPASRKKGLLYQPAKKDSD